MDCVWITIREEGDDFVVDARDLPEVVTSGTDRHEALRLAADAVEVAVAGRMDDEMDLPAPSLGRAGEVQVALPAPLAAKAAIYRAFRSSGLRLADLARVMNRAETDVRTILDPREGTPLDVLDEAARALGGRLTVSFEPA